MTPLRASGRRALPPRRAAAGAVWALVACVACIATVARAEPAAELAAVDLNRAAIEAAVNDVARAVHGRQAPAVRVMEKPAVLLEHHEEGLEISTGLLGLLSTDAQLAMLLSYEDARAAGAKPADPAASRRKGRAAARRDDDAVRSALEACVRAGYSGAEALAAWQRLGAARSAGPIAAGAPGDPKADAARAACARRHLSSLSVMTGRSGAEPYAALVRARLDAWRVKTHEVVAAEGSETPAGTPAGTSGTSDALPSSENPGAWLTYERTGGITGDRVLVTVQPDGQLLAISSRRGQEAVQRMIGQDDMARLRGLLARALAGPARQADASLGSLRDGQIRLLTVRDGERVRRLTLSDGYGLLPGDGELIQLLESLAFQPR